MCTTALVYVYVDGYNQFGILRYTLIHRVFKLILLRKPNIILNGFAFGIQYAYAALVH